MGDIGAVIGIITGLISIFTFLTGASSLQLLRAESRARGGDIDGGGKKPPPRPRFYVRSKVLVWVTFAVFVASLGITLKMGLSGGDVEGAVFLLLLIGGAGVIAFVLRFRHTISPLSFGVVSTLVLVGVGFGLGSVSRGEELVDAVAGLVIGVCITVIAWLFRPGDEASIDVASEAARAAPDSDAQPGPAATDSDQEKAILRHAAEHAGEVTTASVVLETQLSLEDARTLLDNLHERGFCERTRTESGATIYRFPDLA